MHLRGLVWQNLSFSSASQKSQNQIGKTQVSFYLQDPSINITELKEIHSEINLTVPDPILLSNLHDGLEAVRPQFGVELQVWNNFSCVLSKHLVFTAKCQKEKAGRWRWRGHG